MIINSDLTPVTNKAIVDLARYINQKVYVGVRFYNDAGVEVEPTAGTVAVLAHRQTYRAPKAVGTLNATDVSADLEISGPTTEVQATASAVAGATKFKLVIITGV